MITVTNKKTGYTYQVTMDGLLAIKGNKHTRSLFSYNETVPAPEPEEVTRLKKDLQTPVKPKKSLADKKSS